MRTRANYAVTGVNQTLSTTSTGGVYTSADQYFALRAGTFPAVSVYQNYSTPGTYTFIVPAGVTLLSAMAVGGGGAGDDGNSGDGGGGGGSGGSAGYFANLTVTPGASITVVVGAGGPATTAKGTKAPDGGASSVTSGTFVMSAPGGIGGSPYSTSPGASPPSGPSFTNTPVGVTTGGNAGGGGGAGYNGGGGGGGAGGLGGVGGNGGAAIVSYGQYTSGFNGTSGGGGGGGTYSTAGTASTNNGFSSAAGGAGQSDITGGGGGGCATYSAAVPPTAGAAGNGSTSAPSQGGAGGFPGGGGGGSWDSNTGVASKGGDGFVRFVWGTNGSGQRLFPTNAGDT